MENTDIEIQKLQFEMLSEKRMQEWNLLQESEFQGENVLAVPLVGVPASSEGEKKIIIVDEDQLEFPYIATLFQRFHCKAMHLPSLQEALATIPAEKPRMILMNPICKGSLIMDLLEKVKLNDPQLPVLLLVEEGDREAVLDDPRVKLASAIFLKPVDLQRLKDLMVNFLS